MNNAKTIEVDGKHYNIGIWDTFGDSNQDRLRPLNYVATDMFFICFSLISHSSYESAKERWLEEVRLHQKYVAITLIGTKLDLRDDPETCEKLYERNSCPISTELGISLSKKIGAVNYFECSSFSGLNFDIFEKTVQYIEQRDYEYRKKCILF